MIGLRCFLVSPETWYQYWTPQYVFNASI